MYASSFSMSCLSCSNIAHAGLHLCPAEPGRQSWEHCLPHTPAIHKTDSGQGSTSGPTLGCHKPVIPMVSNFSDASSWIFLRPKGSTGHVFTVCRHTENQNQASFSPFGPHEISVLIRTPALSFNNRCAAPAKHPTWLCLPHNTERSSGVQVESQRPSKVS